MRISDRVRATLLVAACTFANGWAVAQPLSVSSRALQWRAKDKTESDWVAEKWASGALKLPFVAGGASGVAADINEQLYLRLLDAPAPVSPGKTFNLPEGVTPGGTTAMDFRVLRSDERVLSIGLTGEGCGAYCEEWVQAYSFDVRTGQALALDELLTPAGLIEVAQRMSQARRQRYEAQIRQLKRAQPAAGAASAAEGEVDDDMLLAFNQDCRARESTRRPSAAAAKAWAQYIVFSLPADKGLKLRSERCGAHVNRALDEVGDVELTLPVATLVPWLSPYGRALLVAEPASLPQASPFDRTLHGKVGNAAVTMLLKRPWDGGSFGGWYFYDKYRQPISLGGHQKGNQILLKEEGPDGSIAEFALSFQDGALMGQWRGKGSPLPVSLGGQTQQAGSPSR